MLNPRDDAVARAQELSELDSLLGAAASAGPAPRRAVCAVVEGPQGIGKTALCEAFLQVHPELTVALADTSPWERGLPGGVLAQLGLPRSEPADDESAQATDPPHLHPHGEPEWLPAGRAALEGLTALTAEGPAVVVLDGLEHADTLSLEALAYAVRRVRTPLFVLATENPATAVPSSPAVAFSEAVRARRIRLAPLPPEDLRALARARTGAELSPEAAQSLWRVSRGNPGLALEALEHGLEALGPEGLAAHGPDAVVPSVAARTAAALALLPPAARSLVEAVSVLGGTPTGAAAAQLAGLPADDAGALLAAADAAWSAGLLECRTVAGSLQLTIREPLVRDAVHDGLGPGYRAALHSHAARLATSTRERVRHLVAAAVMPDAGLAAEVDTLADEEAAEGDWSAAADALVAASQLHIDPVLREDRLLRAAEAMVGAGDLPQAAPLARRIESLPQSAARDAVLAYYAIHKGQARRAAALLDRAWETRDPLKSAGLASRIAQYRVLDSLAEWDIPALLDWTATAVRLAGPNSTAGIEARAMLGLGLGCAGRPEEARQAYDELGASPQLGGRDQRLHLGRGWLALALDDLDEARLELRAAIPPARRPGALRITLWAHAWLARAEFTVGRWDDALAVARSGIALNAPVGMDLVGPLLHFTAAQVHALRGEPGEAAAHSRLAQPGPEAYPVMHLGGSLAAASVAECAGDYPGVLRAFEPVARMDRSHGIDEPGFWPWQDVYANALVMTGRIDAADAFLRPLEATARGASHRSTIARLGYVRGRILGAQGRLDDAVRCFEESLAQLEGLHLPYNTARGRFAYGQTLRRFGRRRDATEVLASARDAFASVGAMVYVARCERELHAAGTGVFRAVGQVAGPGQDAGGHRQAPGAQPPSTAFTPQEAAVARLVAAGLSNRDASRELFVSVKTVQYHLTRIYAKLGISSRGELAALYRASDEFAAPE
ncbi:LuxR family transcriptional regulator [Sinomonas cyclohexanicum]|uniref:LuxR family transcriptional regulator n=1 Tax=Sinomonas cyclohexanicum TaxID=322009 RepID=A0ABN6FJ92_SINCY|nr:AAA family ATPase [Corynebacterium cyclohexanicum]BCT76704.1 LuxR family transcriptional regulator [Corynebacterium cyclohexanicum]